MWTSIWRDYECDWSFFLFATFTLALRTLVVIGTLAVNPPTFHSLADPASLTALPGTSIPTRMRPDEVATALSSVSEATLSPMRFKMEGSFVLALVRTSEATGAIHLPPWSPPSA